jgi:cysteine desulfurase/selenocysteine lyase
MTIKTPIADPAVAGLHAPADPIHDFHGIDLQDVLALANQFFREIPRADGLGRGPSVFGADSAVSGARSASQSTVNTSPPISFSGAGFSPTGIPAESLALQNNAVKERIPGEAPGSALAPSGLSSIGPGDLRVAPGFDGLVPDLGLGASVPASSPSVNPVGQGGDTLYIVNEFVRRDRQSHAPHIDPSTARDHQNAPSAPSGRTDFHFPDAPDLGLSRARPVHTQAGFDVHLIRAEFPILSEKINGRPLIWFDNGATTQKPRAVIERLTKFYEKENSNVHRAAHTLAARATDAYEKARSITARFIGTDDPREIVFVRGCTEAINLVATSFGEEHIGEGDDIILSHLEHHANIVPWQQLAKRKGANLKIIPVDDTGQIILEDYVKLLSERTKIVSVTHISNALGTIVPIKAVIDLAHGVGAKVLIDAAQSIAHERINVRALDADFLVFSGHKVFAPTGIGVLYGKYALLDRLKPYQTGGNMIADVTFERSLFQPPPQRFEAGTGNLADAVGLGSALEFLESIGIEAISAYDHALHAYASEQLKTIPDIRIFGTAKERTSVLSFLIGDAEPTKIGRALDGYGIAVRAGHHCAQPILRRFGVEGTVRASLALYNTFDEVDCFITALREIARRNG